jgi:adenine phosphoribosyltransferase
LLSDAEAFAASVDLMWRRMDGYAPEAVIAIESRGFLFGAALSYCAGLPLELVRKKGKLPGDSHAAEYDLEYGTDSVEIHSDVIREGGRYAIVDDLIATGGTARAAAELVNRQGGKVVCFSFLIELEQLGGREKLGDTPVDALICYTS